MSCRQSVTYTRDNKITWEEVRGKGDETEQENIKFPIRTNRISFSLHEAINLMSTYRLNSSIFYDLIESLINLILQHYRWFYYNAIVGVFCELFNAVVLPTSWSMLCLRYFVLHGSPYLHVLAGRIEQSLSLRHVGTQQVHGSYTTIVFGHGALTGRLVIVLGWTHSNQI